MTTSDRGRRRPTTANVDNDDEATNGRRRRSTANVNNNKEGVDDDKDVCGGLATRPRTSGAAVPRPTSPTIRPRAAGAPTSMTRSQAAGAAVPPQPRPSPMRPRLMTTRPQPKQKAPPPRPTSVVETVNEESSSGTGQEVSLVSEDEFTRKDVEDDGTGDPTAVPRLVSMPSDEQ